MVKVLGVNIFDKNIENAVLNIINECLTNDDLNNYCVSATGAHGLVYAYRNPYFKRILDGFYLNLPDGMPNVWIGKLSGAHKMERCPGPDFFASLLTRSSHKSINHFFCGGKEGVAEELKGTCEKRFSNHNIVGTFSPPFRDMTDEEMLSLGDQIIKSKTDVVWIGLSTPKQESFANRLKKFTKTRFIITVGAAFDFHAGKVKKAPNWISKIGLEWLFRLMMEPKRLSKRYFKVVPLFIYYNLKELFSSSINIYDNKLKQELSKTSVRSEL